MPRSTLLALMVLGCSVGTPDEMPEFSGDADGEQNETFETGSETAGADETAAGDGRVRLKQYQAQKGACAC